ncbi:MAG: 1-acyl-sn-glycerol-3-phosphate acyltransferase [Prevotella sp.]|nr:1-acyl-sn-glycerol-3-phosphate acyltransferase [Prevotella sp.]
MWKSFCQWLLYRQMGWTADVSEPHPDKYIICLAPHTSNWDFLIGQLYSGANGIKSNFLMKKEWFFWPLGPIFRRIGGIPVWRSKHTSMTDNLAETARRSRTFHLCITPEGTRSLNPEWKKGFYYIAQKAEIPILLYGVDYSKKRITCTRTIVPDGDIDRQMREIKLYFKDLKGKNPELFTVGEI